MFEGKFSDVEAHWILKIISINSNKSVQIADLDLCCSLILQRFICHSAVNFYCFFFSSSSFFD